MIPKLGSLFDGSGGFQLKLWGNGVALPPTLYVMRGVAEALRKERSDNEK